MSGPDARTATSSRRKQNVDELLADLSIDIQAPATTTTPTLKTPSIRTQGTPSYTPPAEAQSVLDDLEGLVQRRRYSPSPRTPLPPAIPRLPQNLVSPEKRADPAPKPASPAQPAAAAEAPEAQTRAGESTPGTAATATDNAAPSSAWGQWGTLLSSASKFAGQARHELERRAAEIGLDDGQGELSLHHLSERFTKGVRGIVGDANLGKFSQDISKVGRRGWNDILNVVAPPMEAHEMVQVSLSYDLVGVSGIDSMAFRTFMRVLQQVDVHDVTVVRASEAAQPQATAHEEDTRYQLAPSASRAQALETAFARIAALCDSVASADTAREQAAAACPLIVRIQPFYEEVTGTAGAGDASAWLRGTAPGGEKRHLVFIVWLADPLHRLSHHTTSQAVPAWWRTYGMLTISITCRRVGRAGAERCYPGRTGSRVPGVCPGTRHLLYRSSRRTKRQRLGVVLSLSSIVQRRLSARSNTPIGMSTVPRSRPYSSSETDRHIDMHGVFLVVYGQATYCFSSASVSTERRAARFSATRSARRSRTVLLRRRRASIWSARCFERRFSALALWMCSIRTRLFLNTLPFDLR